MNTLKKALCIVLGIALIVLGLSVFLVAILVANLELHVRIIGVISAVVVAVFGWWLLRRGSKSARDALDWLITALLF